jgi:hypothetical protein
MGLCLGTVACGDGSEVPRDVVTDRVAPDGTGGMDASLDGTPSGLDASSTSDAPSSSADGPDPRTDAPAPMTEGGGSSGCCRAFSPMNQGTCDGLEPFGPDRCNMINDGTLCTWSLDARCADAGPAADAAPPMDASPPPNCCLAISPINADLCSTLTRFGRDRCNGIDSGGTCRWSGAAVCNPLPPTDAGASMDVATFDVVTDGRDGAIDVVTDARDGAIDAVTDARDGAIDVAPDVEPPGCCLARVGTNGTTCRGATTSRACGLMSLSSCVWSTSPTCGNPLGSNGACCMGTMALYTTTCARYSTAAECQSVLGRCTWRCP